MSFHFARLVYKHFLFEKQMQLMLVHATGSALHASVKTGNQAFHVVHVRLFSTPTLSFVVSCIFVQLLYFLSHAFNVHIIKESEY